MRIIGDVAREFSNVSNEQDRIAMRMATGFFETIFAAVSAYSVYRLGSHILDLESIMPVTTTSDRTIPRLVAAHANTMIANMYIGSSVAAGALAASGTILTHKIRQELKPGIQPDVIS